MNRVELIGRLVRDPELRQTQSGKKVATFTLAVDRRTKDEATDFINCVAWEKRAETITKYVYKGNRLGVCGSIQTRKYEKKDGTNAYATEVIVGDIDFLENKKGTEQATESNGLEGSDTYDTTVEPTYDLNTDDLPF